MKTTPTLGLKLYDGTDAPDLVSGYNASMETLDGSGVLAFQGNVQDSTDWDTIIDAGYYNCNNTIFSSANHSPVGSYNYGVLIVYKRCDTLEESKCVTQFYYPHAGGFVDRNPVSRAYYSNAWSAWAPVVHVPDVEGALPANGAAGQVLVKSSASDYDCEWMDPTALDTIHEIKSGPDLTAWLKAFPSTGEWWSGPGKVTITANASTEEQYTGNWTVYRTPSIGNAYFQGSEGREATAHFASLKTDHNGNWWAFVMSIKDTEPTFQYVGVATTQLTAVLKRVTTIVPS